MRGEVGRRAVLAGAVAGVGGGLLGPGLLGPGLLGGVPARADVRPEEAGLVVQPRSAWTSAPPLRPMPSERPGDVRVLLVHHTASSNAYSAASVPAQLESFRRYHTSPEKGWPDIAYNFLVDRYGGCWEGRAGSLAGPVQGDATGGSQGFDQKVCFIGTHAAEPPTPAASETMLRLLAWLASRYGVPTAVGATATFPSRGSNRFPAGTTVRIATLACHRDLSLTSCPGEVLAEQVAHVYPREVGLRTAGARQAAVRRRRVRLRP